MYPESNNWLTDSNITTMPDTSGLPDPEVPMDQTHESTLGGSTLNGDTVKFTSDAPSIDAALPSMPDMTCLSKAPSNALLQDFLRRPVNIHTFTWDGNTSPFHIDPWALFLNTPSVVDKTTYYRYLRGTLNIDIQVNGTPFHFGRILVSYEPCNWNRNSEDGNYGQHSALPHVMLDPSANTVGKIRAPFISPNLWIDAASSYGAGVGVLNFDTVAQLRVFEGGPPPKVTVQVYAWMEDLELSFPTQKVPATYVEQAKKTKGPNGGQRQSDEYTETSNAGLISASAAAVARVAGRLKGLPVIGEFATATEIGANAVSSIAKIFGFSRPRDLNAETVVLNSIVPDMPSTDSAIHATTFTVGSKSELSVDPHIIGLGDDSDELTIQAIASKWAIADVIDWTSQLLPNDLLRRTAIHPGMYVGNAADPTVNSTQLTPVAFASIPFVNWTGSMEVRIQVVASRYHRGRLRFQWTSDDALLTDIQKGYNHVVDISDSKEYHFKLPYVGVEGFKRVSDWESGGFNRAQMISTYDTGTLSIIVQNELSCPTIEPIQLIVWVRGGEDLAFANPDFSVLAQTSKIPGASPNLRIHDEVREQGGATEELGASAEKETEMITFFDTEIHPHYDLAYYGDPITSFRSLLKRYTYTTTLSTNIGLSLNQLNVFGAHIPLYPQQGGYVDYGSWTTASGGNPVNCTNTHLANYLSCAFLGVKGGFRHIVDFSRADSYDNIQVSNLRVKRSNNRSSSFSVEQNSIGDTVAVGPRAAMVGLGKRGGTSQRLGLDNNTHMGGTIFPYQSTGNRISFELPFYYEHRYATTMGDDLPTGNPQFIEGYGFGGSSAEIVFDIFAAEPSIGAIEYNPVLDIYSAAAEDFTMHFFRGVPLLYYDTLPSAPTDITDAWAHTNFPQN